MKSPKKENSEELKQSQSTVTTLTGVPIEELQEVQLAIVGGVQYRITVIEEN